MSNNYYFKVNKGISLTPQSTEPTNAKKGDMYFDDATATLKIYNGTTWEEAGSGSSITLTGDVTGSGTGTISTSLETLSPDPAGSYTLSNITVDSKGRITSASSGSLPTLSPDPSGSYTNANITVDANGRITSASNGSSGSNLALTFDTVTDVGLKATSASYDGSAAVTLGIDNTIVATLTDSQILTNKTIDASSNTISNIPNSSLVNSSITINGTPVSLGGSTTVSATISNLTVGSGLQLNSGTVFDGTVAKTVSIDSTVVTLTGSQTLTNKTLNNPFVIGYIATSYILGVNPQTAASGLLIETSSSPPSVNTGDVTILTGVANDAISGDIIIRTGNALTTSAPTVGTGSIEISTNGPQGSGNTNGIITVQSPNTYFKISDGSLISEFNFQGLQIHDGLGLFLHPGMGSPIQINAPSLSGGYTITLPEFPPTDGTSLLFDGTNYIWGETNKAPTMTKLTTTGSGTYTTPSGVKYLKIRMVGGGGSGAAGSGGATPRRGGGGGGGGGYVEFIINSPAASYSYVVGAAGSSTIFSTCTANAGSSGVSGSSGGGGGSGGGGTLGAGLTGFVSFGQGGSSGDSEDLNPACGGAGGSSLLGGGGRGSSSGTTSGQAANANTGGGGAGGGTSAASGGPGGAGGSGIIIIEEYYKY